MKNVFNAYPTFTLESASGTIINNTPGSGTANTLIKWSSGDGIHITDSSITDIAGTVTANASVIINETLNVTGKVNLSGLLVTDLEGGIVRADHISGLTGTDVQISGSYFDRGIKVYESGSKPVYLDDVLWRNTADNHLYHNDTDLEASTATGDVVGPASATDTAIALFDTTTGKLIKNSVVLIDTAGAVTLPLGGSIKMNTTTFLHYATNINSIYCGPGAGNVSASGSFNACLGTQAGSALTSGQINTLIGYRAGSTITTGSNNIMIGNQAGLTMGSTFSNNIYLGNFTGFFGESGTMRLGGPSTVKTIIRGIYGNTLSLQQMVVVTADRHLGSQAIPTGDVVGPAGPILANQLAAFTDTTGKVIGVTNATAIAQSNCLAMGDANYAVNISRSQRSTGFGTQVFYQANSGDDSCAFGYKSMTYGGPSNANSAFGSKSLGNLTGGSGGNCAFGYNALNYVSTGSYHVAMGYLAGSAYNLADTNNICIGGNVTGTVGESNVIRLGHSSHTSAYITGILGVTPAGTPQVVTIGTGRQLGSTTAAAVRNNYTITTIATDNYAILTSDQRVVFNFTGLGVTTYHATFPAAVNKMNLYLNLFADAGSTLIVSVIGADEVGYGGGSISIVPFGQKILFSDGLSWWFIASSS